MTGDPRDYKLDISSMPSRDEPPPSAATRRPYLSISFECCRVYQRIYRDPSDNAYRGHCPKCGKKVQIAVGPGGTAARFFRAS
jgi:hypothetical protein